MSSEDRQKIALVFGNLPTVDEIDQFKLLVDSYDVTVISSESICDYLDTTSRFHNLRCVALPDYDENPTYLPGLESILGDFDVVVIKERLGMYAYQAVKAKWKSRFRLVVWFDNLATYPGEDIDQMRTIRVEVLNAADGFLVQSDAAENSLRIEGVEAERIFKFNPYVERSSTRNKKARAAAMGHLGLPESSILISYFGPMEWEENLIDLAGAVKLAAEKDASLGRRLRVALCGIGSFATHYGELLVAMGIDDRCIFVAPSRDAFVALQNASDAVYISSIASRDRVDGDPYRYLSAMANEIPIISNRSPIVEELCGKHRFDFCISSPSSIADAIAKVADATSLRNNIVKKNAATVKSRFSQKVVKEQMTQVFDDLSSRLPSIDESSLDHQVIDVESLVASKQYLRAIDVIESIFKIDSIPQHHAANLYRLIGDCFAKLSDNDSAKNAYIKAVEIDPYLSKAHIGLGTVALVKQGFDIAIIHFQKAVSISPEDEMANLGLGLAFQGLEEFQEANKWVAKALEINPENTVGLYTLVKIAYEVEEFANVDSYLEAYVENHPSDHNMLFTLGGVKFKLGKYEEVVDLMKRIVSADSSDERAHGLIRQAQRALEQTATSNA